MRNVKARGATLKATEQPIDANSAKTPSISRRHLPAVVLVSGILASDRHRAPRLSATSLNMPPNRVAVRSHFY